MLDELFSGKRTSDASHPDELSPRITNLLHAWSDGDPEVLDELVPLVNDELRRLAAHHMRDQRAGHTLQATALIHEAYLVGVVLAVRVVVGEIGQRSAGECRRDEARRGGSRPWRGGAQAIRSQRRSVMKPGGLPCIRMPTRKPWARSRASWIMTTWSYRSWACWSVPK